MSKQEFKPGDFLRPVLPGKGNTDYERYLRTDDLLSLQKEPQERAHPDELTFQVVHQSSELMMKGAHADLVRAIAHIQSGELEQAGRLIRRAFMLLDRTTELLAVLETLNPYDYHLIRAGLGHGSGLQSPGFLNLLHIGPQLGEAFHAHLSVAGITPEQLYRDTDHHFPLYTLAELLLDFDERMQLFRFLHLKLAERIIGGDVIGTGGNPVDILRQRQEHSFYKSLWEARNEITRKVNAATGEKATGHGEI